MTTPDFSYLATLECPRRFYYAFRRNLVPSLPNLNLLAGSAVHDALHVLYSEGFGALERAIKLVYEAYEGVVVPAASHLKPELLENVLRNYVEDRSETEFQVLDLGELKLAETPVIAFSDGEPYGGKIDLAVELAGAYYVLDHKTTSGWLREFWARRFRMSHQLRGYALLLEKLTGLMFQGALVNGIYMGQHASDPKEKWSKRASARSRLFGPYTFSQGHIQETEDWVIAQKAEIKWRDYRDEAGAGITAWPPRPELGQCGYCAYERICEQPPTVREAIIKQHYKSIRRLGVLASGADDVQEET